MPKYCGIIKRVGNKEGDLWINSGSAMSNVRVSGKVSVIEIGDTMLRNVGCTNDIFDLLDLGRDACLFVHYKWKTPIILGVKYSDGDKKYLIGLGTIFASIFSSLFFPVLIGGFLGLILTPGPIGILIFLAIVGLPAWNVVKLLKVYSEANSA